MSKTNPTSISGTLDRVYDQIVTTRKDYLKTKNTAKEQTAAEAKQKMAEKRAATKERDINISIKSKGGMSLENY